MQIHIPYAVATFLPTIIDALVADKAMREDNCRFRPACRDIKFRDAFVVIGHKGEIVFFIIAGKIFWVGSNSSAHNILVFIGSFVIFVVRCHFAQRKMDIPNQRKIATEPMVNKPLTINF